KARPGPAIFCAVNNLWWLRGSIQTKEKPAVAGKNKKEKHTMANHATPSAETASSSAILTKASAAELLGCTERFLERAIRSKQLRACKVSRRFVRIYRTDIDRFLRGESIAA